MDRRTAISRIALVMGGSFLSTDSLFAAASRVAEDMDDAAPGIGIFTKAQVKMLDEIADVILPRTKTPGAKDAKTVGSFMATYISDCHEKREQELALRGLATLDEQCKKRFGKKFMKTKREQLNTYFAELDAEQRAYTKSKTAEQPPHWFRVFWELSLFGFFTSKVGSEQVLRYVQVPGRYETIDYKSGDRAWGG